MNIAKLEEHDCDDSSSSCGSVDSKEMLSAGIDTVGNDLVSGEASIGTTSLIKDEGNTDLYE